jgi:small subunit ribosomal protein S17
MSTTGPSASTTEKKEAIHTTFVGVVESDKRDKTRKVVVNWLARHPKYGKYMRRRTVLHVHDEKNESRSGDTVEVRECRPLSKTKRFTLVRVVAKSTRVELVQA